MPLTLNSRISGVSNEKTVSAQPFTYETLFTNPVCKTYEYDRAIITESGKTVSSKPDNVYCKPSDEASSVSRKT